ncbi:MAG: hypothetical protein WBX15_08660 [Thermoanaerobaculia bacterium]
MLRKLDTAVRDVEPDLPESRSAHEQEERFDRLVAVREVLETGADELFSGEGGDVEHEKIIRADGAAAGMPAVHGASATSGQSRGAPASSRLRSGLRA